MEDIQEAYFSMVTQSFGDLEKFRKEVHATPYEMARWLAVQDDLIKANVAGILDFVAEVRDFWEHVAPPIWMHTQEQQTLKAVFTGEIFPDAGQNPASMYGFYVDTVVLPDPFLKMADVLPLMSERKRVSEIARLGLQMLQFRDLALTIADPPLLVVLPDRFGLETDYQSSITDIAAPDAVYHASRLFGREFLDSADVVDFVTGFETPAEVVGAIRRSEYLLFDVDWRGTPVQQLQRYLSSSLALPGIDQPGLQLWMQIVGRMGQATDALIRSAEVGGVPVMHAPTSWRWFNWKLERGGGDEPSDRDLEHLHTVQALRTAAGNQFRWFGNVPPEALVAMRQEGALEEIRHMLSDGVAELAAASPTNFVATTNQVVGNLRLAFSDHQRAIREIEAKRWKFAGRDVSTFLVTGAVEIAAATTGNIPLALAGLVGGMFAKSVPDLLAYRRELRSNRKQLDSSPVGLLFARKPKPQRRK